VIAEDLAAPITAVPNPNRVAVHAGDDPAGTLPEAAAQPLAETSEELTHAPTLRANTEVGQSEKVKSGEMRFQRKDPLSWRPEKKNTLSHICDILATPS
jgi:hypothetical protein